MSFKEGATKDLKAIKKILDKLKIPFFLNYGTLLGAYRDKDFIANDRDIDIGILNYFNREKILDALKAEGFYEREGQDHSNICIKRNVIIDIYIFKERNNNYIDGLSNYIFPKEFDKLKPIKFLGMTFLRPDKIEKYLQRCYGDWKTPEKKSVKRG